MKKISLTVFSEYELYRVNEYNLITQHGRYDQHTNSSIPAAHWSLLKIT